MVNVTDQSLLPSPWRNFIPAFRPAAGRIGLCEQRRTPRPPALDPSKTMQSAFSGRFKGHAYRMSYVSRISSVYSYGQTRSFALWYSSPRDVNRYQCDGDSRIHSSVRQVLLSVNNAHTLQMYSQDSACHTSLVQTSCGSGLGASKTAVTPIPI